MRADLAAVNHDAFAVGVTCLSMFAAADCRAVCAGIRVDTAAVYSDSARSASSSSADRGAVACQFGACIDISAVEIDIARIAAVCADRGVIHGGGAVVGTVGLCVQLAGASLLVIDMQGSAVIDADTVVRGQRRAVAENNIHVPVDVQSVIKGHVAPDDIPFAGLERVIRHGRHLDELIRRYRLDLLRYLGAVPFSVDICHLIGRGNGHIRVRHGEFVVGGKRHVVTVRVGDLDSRAGVVGRRGDGHLNFVAGQSAGETGRDRALIGVDRAHIQELFHVQLQCDVGGGHIHLAVDVAHRSVAVAGIRHDILLDGLSVLLINGGDTGTAVYIHVIGVDAEQLIAVRLHRPVLTVPLTCIVVIQVDPRLRCRDTRSFLIGDLCVAEIDLIGDLIGDEFKEAAQPHAGADMNGGHDERIGAFIDLGKFDVMNRAV